jgi:tetratricopeptide (TPR) repeat protein
MSFQNKVQPNVENFDDYWGLLGDPALVEQKFHELLPQAQALKDQSIYVQMMSQIALAQAVQQKFDAAHKTLDAAQALLKPEYTLAHVRMLLERGRVYQQMGQLAQARSFFEQSYELSKANSFDYHTINAAHMVAIAAENVQDKIAWNERALELAESTKDDRAAQWFGSLYNNIGQNYLEAQQLEKALAVFEKALAYREQEAYVPNIRVARWSIAHTLRLLERQDEAMVMLIALLKEYLAMQDTGALDMPQEAFELARGWVYEDLAEIYQSMAAECAQRAQADLADNSIFKLVAPARLARLQQIIDNASERK